MHRTLLLALGCGWTDGGHRNIMGIYYFLANPFVRTCRVLVVYTQPFEVGR